MLTPQQPKGQAMQGKVKVQVAIKALSMALEEVGALTEDGQAVAKAIYDLTKRFGKSEDDTKSLMPAEIMQIMQKAAGPGAPPGGAKPPAPTPPMQ
jgi:hypothetical protein